MCFIIHWSVAGAFLSLNGYTGKDHDSVRSGDCTDFFRNLGKTWELFPGLAPGCTETPNYKTMVCQFYFLP